jgi:hypothetical protein
MADSLRDVFAGKALKTLKRGAEDEEDIVWKRVRRSNEVLKSLHVEIAGKRVRYNPIAPSVDFDRFRIEIQRMYSNHHTREDIPDDLWANWLNDQCEGIALAHMSEFSDQFFRDCGRRPGFSEALGALTRFCEVQDREGAVCDWR